MIEKFNIRVYALIVNDRNEVLLSDEYFRQTPMTKFPGGGMKPGEGPIDCLRREAMEEMGREVEVLDHCYTTDFFQQSVFYPTHQLICIYYLARFKKSARKFGNIPVKGNKDQPVEPKEDGPHGFRWKSVHELVPEDLTFQADRKAAELLIRRFRGSSSDPIG